MSKLMSGYHIKNMSLKNRIMMAPMCMFCAGEDALATEWHEIHYATRAVGQVGLIMMEATGVESRGRITSRDLGLWKDEQIEGLQRIVKVCHDNDAKIGVQLAHAGRKSEVISEPSIAPSPIRFSDDYRTPVEMTHKDIEQVKKAFRDAAERADRAGYDVIELHAAHGYLISEFLSPLTNKRTDEYGGSLENRVRFLREVLKEVKSIWPDTKPIIVRVSAEDYEEGGNHAQDMAQIIQLVKDEGIDLVNVSSGGVVNVGPKAYPGYQVRFAEMIRNTAAIPVIAGGLIYSPQLAEEILQNERADLVFVGRELLRNPYWPLQAAKELRDDITWPVQYDRSRN